MGKVVVKAVAFCALIGMALSAASPAAARNRTTEMLIADLARTAGVSYQTAYDRSETQEGEDTELFPGIYESSGAFSYSYRGNARTLIAVRIFNENNFAICVRSNAALIGGPMAGSQQGASLGYNVLIEARSSEPVIAHTAARAYSVNTIGEYATLYYFWLAAPPSKERRCSSVAPSGVEAIDTMRLPPAGRTSAQASPELRAKLGLNAPQARSVPAPPAPAEPANRLAWYWLDRINPKDAGPVERLGIFTNEYGPMTTSLAIGRLGGATGTVTATDWFYNASDRSVCVLGKGAYRVLGANGVTKPVVAGAKVVPPRFGTWVADVQRLGGTPPPTSQVLWEVDYYVWFTPKSPATDAGCANSFKPSAFNKEALPRKPGQIILHPLLGGPS